MYSIVKDFYYNLTDMDFLSMLDNADFYSKKVSVKRFYWQKLFQIIAQFVELKNKHEKDALARAMKELTYLRLGKVSSKSFKFFFMKKFFSNRDLILQRLKDLKTSLAAHLQQLNNNNVSSSLKKKRKQKKKKSNNKRVQHYVEQNQTPLDRYLARSDITSFLHQIEARFSGEIIFNTEVAERSAYFPPSIEGSLGLIEFDEISDEKFSHEISHLIHDHFDFASYGLDSDEEYHDAFFWKINEIVSNDLAAQDFSTTLFNISQLRPWNLDVSEDVVVEDRQPTPEIPESSEGFRIGGLNFEERGSLPEYFNGQPRFIELGYENYREPFGFTVGISPLIETPTPENNRGRSRSPGFRTRGVRRNN